jgi:hypothetical protein
MATFRRSIVAALKADKALGLTIPPSLPARADHRPPPLLASSACDL